MLRPAMRGIVEGLSRHASWRAKAFVLGLLGFGGLLAACFALAGVDLARPELRMLRFAYALPGALIALSLHGALGGRPLIGELGLQPGLFSRRGLGRWALVLALAPVVTLGRVLLGSVLSGQPLRWRTETLLASARAVHGEAADAYQNFVAHAIVHPLLAEFALAMGFGAVWGVILYLPQEFSLRGFGLVYARGHWLQRIGQVAALQCLWLAPLLPLGLAPPVSLAGALSWMAATASLGMLLGALRLWSGSIMPGAAWLGVYTACFATGARMLDSADTAWLSGPHGLSAAVVNLAGFGALAWQLRRRPTVARAPELQGATVATRSMA